MRDHPTVYLKISLLYSIDMTGGVWHIVMMRMKIWRVKLRVSW